MALNLKPLGNRVVVEPIEEEEITAGGIVSNDTVADRELRGELKQAIFKLRD